MPQANERPRAVDLIPASALIPPSDEELLRRVVQTRSGPSRAEWLANIIDWGADASDAVYSARTGRRSPAGAYMRLGATPGLMLGAYGRQRARERSRRDLAEAMGLTPASDAADADQKRAALFRAANAQLAGGGPGVASDDGLASLASGAPAASGSGAADAALRDLARTDPLTARRLARQRAAFSAKLNAVAVPMAAGYPGGVELLGQTVDPLERLSGAHRLAREHATSEDERLYRLAQRRDEEQYGRDTLRRAEATAAGVGLDAVNDLSQLTNFSPTQTDAIAQEWARAEGARRRQVEADRALDAAYRQTWADQGAPAYRAYTRASGSPTDRHAAATSAGMLLQGRRDMRVLDESGMMPPGPWRPADDMNQDTIDRINDRMLGASIAQKQRQAEQKERDAQLKAYFENLKTLSGVWGAVSGDPGGGSPRPVDRAMADIAGLRVPILRAASQGATEDELNALAKNLSLAAHGADKGGEARADALADLASYDLPVSTKPTGWWPFRGEERVVDQAAIDAELDALERAGNGGVSGRGNAGFWDMAGAMLGAPPGMRARGGDPLDALTPGVARPPAAVGGRSGAGVVALGDGPQGLKNVSNADKAAAVRSANAKLITGSSPGKGAAGPPDADLLEAAVGGPLTGDELAAMQGAEARTDRRRRRMTIALDALERLQKYEYFKNLPTVEDPAVRGRAIRALKAKGRPVTADAIERLARLAVEHANKQAHQQEREDMDAIAPDGDDEDARFIREALGLTRAELDGGLFRNIRPLNVGTLRKRYENYYAD